MKLKDNHGRIWPQKATAAAFGRVDSSTCEAILQMRLRLVTTSGKISAAVTTIGKATYDRSAECKPAAKGLRY